jgi:hypothetical protein
VQEPALVLVRAALVRNVHPSVQVRAALERSVQGRAERATARPIATPGRVTVRPIAILVREAARPIKIIG